ncbi:MAG: ATP synthase F1 subunit gamma [Spirochaetaceae bacterium]|jgi:F-type H+-transporting ATPase subunit gamma|nr:ATP synthase F1 subunit gamma [Spirochaetaceae bacterium]
MANLRDIRVHMKSIAQTLKVTNAMNLISTAKLRKGRRLLTDTEPYFDRIQKTMAELLRSAGKVQSPYFAEDSARAGRTGVIVVTSDKGLAGGYNANIFRYVLEVCKKVCNPVLVLIGNIGQRYFVNTPYMVLENFSFASRMPLLEEANEISEYVISQFTWGVFSEVRIVYTHMYNTLKLLPAERVVLPFDIKKMRIAAPGSGFSDIEQQKPLNFDYIPSPEGVFDALAPQYITGLVYGCLVEAYASEQSARMSAMDEASKNARDILERQQLSYNHVRQTGITQEVTEIVSGSEALID